MRLVAPLVLLTLLLAPMAAAEEFIFDSSLYSAQTLEVRTETTGTISTSGDVRSLTAHLQYYPHTFAGQEVLSLTTTPEAEREDGALTYIWHDPANTIRFSAQSTVRTTYHRPRITERITFPYAQIPPEHETYLREQELIRVTPEISAQAAAIVGDEEDAVRAVFLLGKWVKDNIAYDLNTVTAEASQPSDWVLENRYGVCDELTSLFIAMVRSQGIPARFISGIAYTNLESLDTHWGPHGWAEVWYPEVGWVPYDVTYGQFGFVDATHIAFQESADSTANAAEYTMRSRNGQLQPGGLERETTLISREGTLTEDLAIHVDVAADAVGFGSANRVDATIRNTKPYYVSRELFLSRTEHLTTSDASRSILLGPYEERTLHWLISVDEDLPAQYSYTFPVAVYTNTNTSHGTTFTADRAGLVLSEESLRIQEDAGARPLDGTLQCEYPTEGRIGQAVTVTCSFPRAARLCIDSCVYDDTITETHTYDALGVHTLVVTARDGARSTRRILSIPVLDEPSLSLSLEAPDAIGTSTEGAAIVRLEKTSFSTPQNLTVTLTHPLFTQEWTLEDLSQAATLELRVPGAALHAGENSVTAHVTYQNATKERSASIQALPESLPGRLTLWGNWLVWKLGLGS